MKKVLVFLLATALLLPALQSWAQEKKPPKPDEEKRMVIPGNEDWVNTQVKVKPKDKLVIFAEGEVCFSSGDKDSCVGPEGWNRETYNGNWPNDYYQCDDPMMELNHAALLGNIGSDDFLVGKENSFTGKEGTLYLGINDCSFSGEYHNTGEFTVKILVYRKK